MNHLDTASTLWHTAELLAQPATGDLVAHQAHRGQYYPYNKCDALRHAPASAAPSRAKRTVLSHEVFARFSSWHCQVAHQVKRHCAVSQLPRTGRPNRATYH